MAADAAAGGCAHIAATAAYRPPPRLREIHRRPGPDLPVPAMSATRLAWRPRPHHSLRRRRTNLPLQPRRPLPNPPHPQAPPQLEPPPDRTRHLHLDHPSRTHLHRKPRHPHRIGSPAECPGTRRTAARRAASSKAATARERGSQGRRQAGGRGQWVGEGDGRQPGHEERPISQPGMPATANGGHSSWAGITRQCHGRSSNGGCPGATPAAAPQAIPAQAPPLQATRAQTASAQTAPAQTTPAQAAGKGNSSDRDSGRDASAGEVAARRLRPVTRLPARPAEQTEPAQPAEQADPAQLTEAAQQTEPAWAELHCHSSYSFLDGASSPAELVAEALKLGLTALAITDHDGMYGVPQFAQAVTRVKEAGGTGLRTVFGAELEPGPARRAGRHPRPSRKASAGARP